MKPQKDKTPKKCNCDGNSVFGGDNHSSECHNPKPDTRQWEKNLQKVGNEPLVVTGERTCFIKGEYIKGEIYMSLRLHRKSCEQALKNQQRAFEEMIPDKIGGDKGHATGFGFSEAVAHNRVIDTIKARLDKLKKL